MNVTRFLAVAAAAGCMATAAASPGSDVAALHAVDQNFLTAFNAGDADALAALYDENAVLQPPGAPAVKGRAAIRAYFAHEAPGSAKSGVTFSLGAQPAGGAQGGLGWAAGTYTVKDKDGKTLDTGKYLSVSKKTHGKWLYLRDTWNSDGAPPADKK